MPETFEELLARCKENESSDIKTCCVCGRSITSREIQAGNTKLTTDGLAHSYCCHDDISDLIDQHPMGRPISSGFGRVVIDDEPNDLCPDVLNPNELGIVDYN